MLKQLKFAFICIFVQVVYSSQSKEDQKGILQKLYFQTTGNAWRYSSGWNQDDDFCSWPNLGCDQQGNVAVINLENQNLQGEIPSELHTLSSLTYLRLQNNPKLRGKIPKEIFRTPNLKYLNLADNALSGTLPVELHFATKLTHFQVTYNKLTGTIPAITDLKQLKHFEVGGNQLHGKVPSMGGLLKLERFSVFSNQLTGTIPLSQAPSLKYYYIDDNKMTGTIPSDFGSKMPNLLDCYIGKNELTGSLPSSIREFTKMHVFYAFENKLSGDLPNELNNMRSLLHLNISSNGFTGKLPDSVGSFTDLREFDVSSNMFSGTLPNAYSTLSKLRTFAITKNQLTGTLPDSWKNWDDLEYFRVSSNKLTGTIPDSWTQFPWIIETRFDDNKFCGSIPQWLVSGPQIHTMALNKNDWACDIPDFCDSRKKFCDYTATNLHGCNSQELADAASCTFMTTPAPTTTTDRGIGANVFTEHLVYSHSKCELHTMVLHDIVGEVGCADEAWTSDECGLWYSFNKMSHHCECVLTGEKCKKVSDPNSSVYKIEDMRGHQLQKTWIQQQPEAIDYRILLVSAFTGFLVSTLLVLYISKQRQHSTSMDEILVGVAP